MHVSSNSSKRRDANRQREQQVTSRAAAEERAWERWAGSADEPGLAPSDMAEAFEIVQQTLNARMSGNEHALLVGSEILSDLRLADGTRGGTTAVELLLVAAVRDRFNDGWQPLDLAHVTHKVLDADHRSLLVAVLRLELQTTTAVHLDDRWRRQLHLLDVIDDVPEQAPVSLFAEPVDESLVARMRLISDVRAAIELMAHLRGLPQLPRLMFAPNERPLPMQSATSATSQLDEKVLGKVRALLAKAESTTFEEEADALTSKAQELMARHAIDLAMLESDPSNGAAASGAVARRIHVEDPYFDPKSVLLAVVARANNCTAVSVPPLGMITLFGFPSDLDIVELLFTSLLTQATSSMVAAGSSVDMRGTSRTKSFRRAFILAFAVRVGERLREATKAATDDAKVTMGESFLPVLASRKEQVEARQKELFPRVRSTTSSITNADGWHAGRAAADRAVLQARVPIAKRR
jgi:Protein of unknown function (DUF2786)